MWRQGDVFIAPVNSIPRRAEHVGHGVLVEGEATGHSHRVEDLRAAEVFRQNSELYLRVVADSARIVHQEHGAIELPHGLYRVWKQREYDPRLAESTRSVLD